MKKILLCVVILVCWASQGLYALNPDIINTNKKGVVSIKVRASHGAYNSSGAWSGTGFVVNKKKGIILTNNHVIGTASAATFEITFFDGQELDGAILYMDPLHDFGFLKVDPAKIPEDAHALDLSTEEVSLNQSVIMIGKNEGQNFSINVGRISSLYESVGHFPNQSYRISLNAQGGASGSPVITEGGKTIALTHSSNLSSSSFALPIAYVTDALKYLDKDKTPPRYFMGAVLSYHSLDRTSKFSQFPKDLKKTYMETYPHALNRALHVGRIFDDSPAKGKLELGDVIWKINGKDIGPNLYKFQKMMNESKDLSLIIYRKGKKKEIKLKAYDLEVGRIRRLVYFGGAIFYEADHFVRKITGAPYGSVFISNVRSGGSFYDRFPPISGTDKLFINVVRLGDRNITSLDDLIKSIPQLKKKEDFYIVFKNYAFSLGHSGFPQFSTHETLGEISYNALDGKAQLIEFNPSTGKWDMTEIG